MTTIFRKTLAAAMTTAVIAGSLAATPASAKYGRNAAFFGGLAIGALAGGAFAGGYSGGYGGGYGCWIDSRPVYNHWGDIIGYRRVRVCD